MVADVFTIPPFHIEVIAYSCGLRNQPDVYRICEFRGGAQRVGVGDRLIMRVGVPPHISSYRVTLKQVMIRGTEVTEFIGTCDDLVSSLCHVQVATPYARINHFPFSHLLRRGYLLLTRRITAMRSAAVQSLGSSFSWTASSEDSHVQDLGISRTRNIVVYVRVESSDDSKFGQSTGQTS